MFIDTFFGRPNTIKAYRSLFRTHIEPAASAARCANWSEADTYNIISMWERRGLASSTQATLLRLLARFVKFNEGPTIDTQRFSRTIQRKDQQKEVTILNQTEATQLMQLCAKRDTQFYPVLLMALHAGLRRGEVYGLTYEDIDYLKGRVRVARSYDGPTKNGKTRYVPLSTELGEAVNRWAFSKRLGDKLFKLEDPNPRLRGLCCRAGVPLINFHALRHTFATLALEAKTSHRKVQEWLGHASLTTTLNIYWGVINNGEESLDFLPGGK